MSFWAEKKTVGRACMCNNDFYEQMDQFFDAKTSQSSTTHAEQSDCPRASSLSTSSDIYAHSVCHTHTRTQTRVDAFLMFRLRSWLVLGSSFSLLTEKRTIGPSVNSNRECNSFERRCSCVSSFGFPSFLSSSNKLLSFCRTSLDCVGLTTADSTRNGKHNTESCVCVCFPHHSDHSKRWGHLVDRNRVDYVILVSV